MAYAALSSLMYTLEQLFKPNQSFVCPSSTQQHVESLHQNLSALQDFLDDTTKDIETLKDLETLHIETLNNSYPVIIPGDIFLPNLNKLTLTRTRTPWKVVKLLANLPNLEVLKGNRAFVGTDWKVDEDVVFHKLKYLQLYGPYDLQRWELAAGSDNFPMLEKLILHELYELEEIPESIGDIMTLKLIQIVDCSSGVVNSAKKIQQEQESLGNYELQLQITPKCNTLLKLRDSSWSIDF